MDGTFTYFVEQINRKLLLVLTNETLEVGEREAIQEVMDTDLPEMTRLYDAVTSKEGGQS